MGFAKLLSGAVNGMEAIPVEIEADASRTGDPQMVIVGLPDATVRESQHRVSTAISNSGYAAFDGRVTVNLAPADIRKDGSLFDLPIALAVLLASGALIAWDIRALIPDLSDRVRHAYFQVSSIMTTTGFSTVDLTFGPPFPRPSCSA